MKTAPIPPHSEESEQALIGSMLVSTEPTMLADLLSNHPKITGYFYDLRNAAIAAAAIENANEGKPTDLISVHAALQASGQLQAAGGLEYVSNLADVVPSAWNASFYADTLRDLAQKRELIREGTLAVQRGFGSDPIVDSLEATERGIMAIRLDADSDTEISTRALMNKVLDQLERAHERKSGMDGVPTGFKRLDWLLGGMKPGQLIIIAARPAVGKTSLGMNMAEHIAVDCGVSVGVFSLEMEAEELGFRMACSRSGVDNKLAQSGGIAERDFPKIHKVVAAIANSPLTIDARGGLTIAQVAARARRMVHRHKIKLLVVDYLSLIAGGGRHENRTAEITRVSNGLKTLAKQLKLPIIALSQLNRDSDKGTPRKPRLSDLRDSGSVEQDADICILLHRDESKEGWEDEPVHRIQLIIAKHRNGPTGLIDMDFHCSTTRFTESSNVDVSAR